MSAMDEFWDGYDRTLGRIREDTPQTVAGVVSILNDFHPKSVGVAFFPSGGDDELSLALVDAGWDVQFIEHDYLWEARSAATGETLHYVEGDIYPGLWQAPVVAGTVWVESLRGSHRQGPFTDEVTASRAMDALGLSDKDWKIVNRQEGELHGPVPLHMQPRQARAAAPAQVRVGTEADGVRLRFQLGAHRAGGAASRQQRP